MRGLGGDISVQSTPVVGSKFTVALPDSDTPLVPKTTAARAPVEPTAARGRILIVDAETSVARTLKALFQNEHDMTSTNDGTQALTAIAALAHASLTSSCAT